MKIFGFEIKRNSKPVEQKTSVSTHYVTADGVLVDGEKIARNLRTYYQLYRINTDVRGVIREIIKTAAKSGYEVYRQLKSEERKKLYKDPKIDLALSDGGKSSFRQLKNNIAQQLLISGTVFVRKKWNAKNEVIGYDVLDTRHITVITDTSGRVLRIIYNDPKSGVLTTFQYYKRPGYIDPIIDVAGFKDISDPDDCVFGISDMETVVVDVLADDQAALSNYYYFQNDSIPPALYVMEAWLTEEQQKAVLEQVKSTLRGGHNKHKSIVSPNIKDIKLINADSGESMKHKDQRKYTSDRVCAAFWVPKVLLGYTDGVNYSNANMEYTKFIENTIRPFEVILNEIFTALIAPFGDNLAVQIIDDHIDSVKEKSDIANKNVINGIWTRNEGRDYIGYEPIENELLDAFTVPSSQTLLESLPAQEPTPEQITDDNTNFAV